MIVEDNGKNSCQLQVYIEYAVQSFSDVTKQ